MSLIENLSFIHIPKAGGTALTEYLFSHVHPGDVYPREKLLNYVSYNDLKGDKLKKLFISHFGYSFYRQAGGAAITVLREPVERILSLYSYWKNPGNGMAPGDPLPDDITLDTFLKSDRPDITTNIDNAQTWQLAFGLDHRTRGRLKGVSETELVDIACKNIAAIQIIGVSENMDPVMLQLGKYFGNPSSRPLRVMNKTIKRLTQNDVSDWALENIQERTTLDKKLYDFAVRETDRRMNLLYETSVDVPPAI